MITLPATLETEMNSLKRTPYSYITVEQFFPYWNQKVAGGATTYAHGHDACTSTDGTILFRARVMANGNLQVAAITGDDLDAPETWDTLWDATVYPGFVSPDWSANSGASFGGAVACAFGGTYFQVYAFKTDGSLWYTNFSLAGAFTGTGQVAAFSADDAMQIASCEVNEVFVLRNNLVESGLSSWHKDVYGADIIRIYNSGGWQQDTGFMFHTHADAHCLKDGPRSDAGSADVEAQWGFRPNGGISVSKVDDDTVLVTVSLRFWFRKAYTVHTQSISGFLYHRLSGLWERVFDNDDADFEEDNQLWVDGFCRGSAVDGRNIVTWVRMEEPADTEQIYGSEHLPRFSETVYAVVSGDGRYLTQYRHVGTAPDYSSASIVAVTGESGLKYLYAIGYTAVSQSNPAALLCDVPEAQKLFLDLSAGSYKLSRTNRWSLSGTINLSDGEAYFNEPLIAEGNLVRIYYGKAGDVVQIARGFIDMSSNQFTLASRANSTPLSFRAEFPLMATKSEVIDDMFPLTSAVIEPTDPGATATSKIINSETVDNAPAIPDGVAYQNGWWLLNKADWPGIFFSGQYPDLEGKLIYAMEASPWAMTGGGDIDLPPGEYGGPGAIAEEQPRKRGTFFSDISWITLEPRIDGMVQSSVRFGDNINYGNATFTALDGNVVSTALTRVNGLIQKIDWSHEGSVWNEVYQESCMAGLICRSVNDPLDGNGGGKKYVFAWEANSFFGLGDQPGRGSSLGDQAGRYWNTLVHDRPDYGSFTVDRNSGAGRFYLYLSDFDESNENWQADEAWVHKAVAHHAPTSNAYTAGIQSGRPIDMRLQVLGGTIHCFYRAYPTGTNPKQRWYKAFSYNSGHFGAGKFGLVGRGHAGIQWDVLYPGKDHIRNWNNTVHFWDAKAADALRDPTLEEIFERHAWYGFTQTEFRSVIDDDGPVSVTAGSYYNGYASPVENPCIDFVVNIDDNGGEAGLFVRATDNDDPFDNCVSLGIVANATYADSDSLVNAYVVKRRYSGGSEVNAGRDYSPIPFAVEPGNSYGVRISVRNEKYIVYIDGNYVGHFEDDTELGLYWGLFATGQDASFEAVRLPELHEVPENSLLDPNQTMMNAINKTVKQRHIKGVFRPDGNLLISRFSEHDTGPALDDTLVSSTVKSASNFLSVVEVQGAFTRATYTNETALASGRYYSLVENPDIMTTEACYVEAKALARQSMEAAHQLSAASLPDIRLEPEDASEVVSTRQDVNGTYIIDDTEFSFDLSGRKDEMRVSGRRQVIL